MALPFLADFGWEPLILKINPDEQEGIKDPDLCQTVPKATRTWQAGCIPLGLTSWFGMRNIGLRSYFHLARTGDRIIREESPAIALFSTTMFPLMTLGRYWRWRHRLAYVLDWQDPWRSKQEGLAKGIKRWVVNFMANYMEPITMRKVAHVVSVSPAYVDNLRAAYPWMRKEQFSVLPFGTAEGDYLHLQRSSIRQNIFDPADGKRHWVYVGRGGSDMRFALKSLFCALAQVLDGQPSLRQELRLHFIGTDYAPKERAIKTIEPVAREFGLGDIVIEKTDRIPYFAALRCLLNAEALIVPGSDDSGYTASKIYPYILACKPLLAVFHARSSVVEVINRTKAGTTVTFQANETFEEVAARIVATDWMRHPAVPATVWSEFDLYTAREMTRRLCQIFDSCVN